MSENNSSELILCPACGKRKTRNFYYKVGDNISKRCRICVKNNVKIKNDDDKPDRIGMEWRIRSIKCDYIMAYKLLSNLGYDLNQDISEQFHKKYNLNNKPEKNYTHLTPEQLGIK